MANKTIHTLITKFFGNDLPDAIQMSFRKWFVGGTHQQEKEEAMRELWERQKQTVGLYRNWTGYTIVWEQLPVR